MIELEDAVMEIFLLHTQRKHRKKLYLFTILRPTSILLFQLG